MTPYILDTDILSLYQRGHPKVRQQCRARPTRHLAITVISVEEQLSGWYTAIRKARSPDDLALAYESLADSQFEAWLAWRFSPSRLRRSRDLSTSSA
ncbi:MAG TPA: hypothetical protein VFF52_19690 [Isosphaeraceae bacterium]|nr:hypothetical protein [Isosphaeraceae bacterium]